MSEARNRVSDYLRIAGLESLGRRQEDVARAVAFLVAEDFITGAMLLVNGGEHLKW